MAESNEALMKKRIHYALLQFLLGFIFTGFFFGLNYLSRSDSICIKDSVFFLIFIPVEMFIYGFFYYPRYCRKQEEYRKKMAALHEVEEFKCFKCGAPIKPEESKCKECGWTWKL